MNVKRFPLARIVVVFLAGVILLVSTACSKAPTASNYPARTTDNVADSANHSGNSSANRPYSAQPTDRATDRSGTYPLEKIQAEHMKESYSTTDAVPGTMNNFKDREPGVDRAGAKADYLVEQAKKNLDKRASNPKEAVDNFRANGSFNKIGDNLNEFTDTVSRNAQDAKEGAVKGFNNLQENVKSAADDVSQNIR
jgi:hypothetical protein